MKLKQLPEDFKVEEIASMNISKDKKSYKVYLLEKNGMETFSLLAYLSKKNKIPVNYFGIAGLKDRHAVTKQYFTIPSQCELSALNENNLKITFLGYADKALELGDLIGNRFDIIVRNIRKGELDGIRQKAKNIGVIGVPNYFDSQRFGSVINNKFVAKFLLKKDYESAVKVYLTEFTKHESGKFKREKKLIAENWNNILSIKVENPSLARVVKEYKKTKSWLEAYKKIPPNLREIMVSAYQSYLWNECIKELLRRTVNKKSLYSISYNIGTLLFYRNLSEEEIKKIPLAFKTISEEIKPSNAEKEIMGKVLSKEGVSIQDFGIKKETGNFFKVHERKVLLKPENFSISEPQIDEINDRGRKNTFKIKLSFSLLKGSYATIITKRIFNH
ncbi:MAG: tRNA pseudouridine(13) synthase TruD [Nanoarchaeota archaeon]